MQKEFTVIGIREQDRRFNQEYIAYKTAENGFKAGQAAMEEEYSYGRIMTVTAVFEGRLRNKMDDTQTDEKSFFVPIPEDKFVTLDDENFQILLDK